MSYSHSHLTKGTDYDDFISGTPFDNYMARMEHSLIEKVIPRLFGNIRPRYLDFACGTGRITQVIAPYASQSYGIDIAESMVEEARKKCPDTVFKIGDYTQQPIDIEPVDFATMFRFVGNAEDDLRRGALRAVSNALSVGGYLLLNNHRNPNALFNVLHRLSGGEMDQDLSYGHLEKLLEEAGFKIVKTHSIGLWLFRHSLLRPNILDSGIGAFLESYLWFPGCVRISPDALIIAQKTRDPAS